MFVDRHGRRRRWVTGLGAAIAAGSLGYVVLLGASLARAPWVPRISVPGLGAVLPPRRAAEPPSLGPNALASPAPVLPSKAPTTTVISRAVTSLPTRTSVPAGAPAPTSPPSTAAATTTTSTTRPGRSRTTTTVAGSPPTTRRGRP